MQQINLATYLPFLALNATTKKSNRQKKRIVFLIHSAELFSGLELVIQNFLNDTERFECIFVALPRDYSTQAKVFTGEGEVFRFLDAKGLNPIAMTGKSYADLFYLIHLAPDYIFRQSPWDHHLPEPFRTPNLSFAKLCYVPYGLMLSGTENAQYNQPFHNFCDFIFSETDFHHNEFKNRRQLGDIGVHLTGSPRLESFDKHVAAHPEGVWPIQVPVNIPKIIWAPHHCFDPKWIGASTFFEHKDLFLEYAQRDDISILFRPHPAMREKVVASGKMSAAEYDHWLQAFESGPFSRLDNQSEYIDQMQASDFMVTDGISFFIEYLVTGKPLIRTGSAHARPLNALGEWLIKKFRNCADQESLRQILEQMVQHRYADDESQERLVVTEFFRGINQNASLKIYAILADDAFGPAAPLMSGGATTTQPS
jgi:hypothetical protein